MRDLQSEKDKSEVYITYTQCFRRPSPKEEEYAHTDLEFWRQVI